MGLESDDTGRDLGHDALYSVDEVAIRRTEG